MENAQAMLARGSMAAALHTPFQTASKGFQTLKGRICQVRRMAFGDVIERFQTIS
jgi:hypothetical protein